MLMRLIACLAALLLLPSLLAAPLTLRTYGRDSPPFYALNPPDRQPTGACPELFAALSEANPQLQFSGLETPMSLSLIEKGLQQHSIDVVCSLGRTPAREKLADFLQLIWQSHHKVMVRKDDAVSVASLSELASLSQSAPVIARHSSVYADRLKQAGVRVDDSSSDPGTLVRKLLAGRGRFYYADEHQLALILREPELQGKLRIEPAPLYAEKLYLAVSKNTGPAERQALQAAFESVRASGRLQAILQKYQLSSPQEK